MDDGELFKEFVKVERAEGGVRISVRQISWNGPAESVSDWAVAKDLHPATTQAEAETAARAILEDERHFRVCRECAERNPLGWMHDEVICQGCALDDHGVVY